VHSQTFNPKPQTLKHEMARIIYRIINNFVYFVYFVLFKIIFHYENENAKIVLNFLDFEHDFSIFVLVVKKDYK